MFKVVQGDIFETKAEVLVNPVNTEGISGAGLALAFKQKFPDNYKEYIKYCKSGKLEPGGTFRYWTESSRIIVNAATKDTWKKPSKYSYIIAALRNTYQDVLVTRKKSVAFPLLGAGLGGLDPNKVIELIINQQKDLDIATLVYVTHKDWHLISDIYKS